MTDRPDDVEHHVAAHDLGDPAEPGSADDDTAGLPAAADGRREGEIDLVAEPVRYPRSPLVALIAIAVVPAVALFVLQRWADREADDYETSRDAVASLEGRSPDRGLLEPELSGGVDADDDGERDPDEPAGGDGEVDDETDAGAGNERTTTTPLATALLDYRRTPRSVADLASARQLGASVAPVFSFLTQRSCGALSVDGVLVTAVNPDLPVIPASNQKLIVGAVALDVLGRDHRFTTSVAVPQPVDGVVDGDVFLIGGGDPVLTSADYVPDDVAAATDDSSDDEFGDEDGDEDETIDDASSGEVVLAATNTTSLDALADAVASSGVERIRGTVIGDGSRYDDEFAVDEWAEGIAGVDAGPYDALLVNDGRVVGRSSIEEDPSVGAAREFVRLLNDRGIQVDNGWGSGAASTLVPVVATVESEPLTAIVEEMLLTSDNNTAELLVKEIGAVVAGAGTRAAGTSVMAETLGSWGLATDGVILSDGSGLSTRNRLTCALVLDVLQRVAGGPIPDMLPVAARSGTLADEFVDSPLAGRLRAKTGTLRNEPYDVDPPAVKSLGGYVDTADETLIEFVMIVNDADISEPARYRPLWDAFADRVDTYPAGPDAAALGPR